MCEYCEGKDMEADDLWMVRINYCPNCGARVVEVDES